VTTATIGYKAGLGQAFSLSTPLLSRVPWAAAAIRKAIAMIHRRCVGFVLAACFLASPSAWGANPPAVDAGGVTGLDLQTQLEKGLRARRPVEFVYIAEIVKLVEDGKLPRKLVTTTFVWARRQPTLALQYFQFALQARARAAHLDVTLPNLRDQAVGINTNGGEAGVTQ